MKKIILIVAILFSIGIIAPAFAENVSVSGSAAIKKQALQLQERNQELKLRYQAAKEQYITAKSAYASAKDDWTSARKAFIERKNNTNATSAMLEKGKNYLLKIVDNRVKHLELIRSKVENMTVLGNAEKADIIADLNVEIDMFTAFKPKISAISTKDGLKNASLEIKAEWIKSRHGVERAAGQIIAVKEERLIESAENISSKIRKRIEDIKANGKDTSAFEAMLSQYNAKIESAKQDIASAKEKFTAVGGAGTAVEKEKLINEGKALLKRATESLREAHKLLKNGIKSAREEIKDNKKKNATE